MLCSYLIYQGNRVWKKYSGLRATLYVPILISGQMVDLSPVSDMVIFEIAKDAQQDYQCVAVFLIFFFLNYGAFMYDEFD